MSRVTAGELSLAQPRRDRYTTPDMIAVVSAALKSS